MFGVENMCGETGTTSLPSGIPVPVEETCRKLPILANGLDVKALVTDDVEAERLITIPGRGDSPLYVVAVVEDDTVRVGTGNGIDVVDVESAVAIEA